MTRDKIMSMLLDKYPELELHSSGHSCQEAEGWDLGFEHKSKPKASLEIHGIGMDEEGRVGIKSTIVENYSRDTFDNVDDYRESKQFKTAWYKDGELPPEVIAAADHFVGAAA